MALRKRMYCSNKSILGACEDGAIFDRSLHILRILSVEQRNFIKGQVMFDCQKISLPQALYLSLSCACQTRLGLLISNVSTEMQRNLYLMVRNWSSWLDLQSWCPNPSTTTTRNYWGMHGRKKFIVLSPSTENQPCSDADKEVLKLIASVSFPENPKVIKYLE